MPQKYLRTRLEKNKLKKKTNDLNRGKFMRLHNIYLKSYRRLFYNVSSWEKVILGPMASRDRHIYICSTLVQNPKHFLYPVLHYRSIVYSPVCSLRQTLYKRSQSIFCQAPRLWNSLLKKREVSWVA